MSTDTFQNTMDVTVEYLSQTSRKTSIERTTLEEVIPTTESKKDDQGLRLGVIIGIAVSCAVVIIIIVAVIVCCSKRRRTNRKRASQMRPKSKKRWTNIWRNITNRTRFSGKAPPSQDELDAHRSRQETAFTNAYAEEPSTAGKTAAEPDAHTDAQVRDEAVHISFSNLPPRDKTKTTTSVAHTTHNVPSDIPGDFYTDVDQHEPPKSNTHKLLTHKVSPHGYISMHGKPPPRVGGKHGLTNHVVNDVTVEEAAPSSHAPPKSPGYVNVMDIPSVEKEREPSNYVNVTEWTGPLGQSVTTPSPSGGDKEMTEIREDVTDNPEYINIPKDHGSHLDVSRTQDRDRHSFEDIEIESENYYNKHDSPYYNKFVTDSTQRLNTP